IPFMGPFYPPVRERPLVPSLPGGVVPFDLLLELVVYLSLGVVAGLLAGLLGVGGGLVIVAVLAWLLPVFGIPQQAAMRAALASSLASIVLTAASSARAHHRRGSVLWPTVARLVPGVLLGGALGDLLASSVAGATLRW